MEKNKRKGYGKTKTAKRNIFNDSSSKKSNHDNDELVIYSIDQVSAVRKFTNITGSLCWLNSTMQVILTIFDHYYNDHERTESIDITHSELWTVLKDLKNLPLNDHLNIMFMKDVMVTTTGREFLKTLCILNLHKSYFK